MYKYKLKNGLSPDDTFIPGVAISKEGLVESPVKLESAILEPIGETQPPVSASPAVSATPVTPAAAPINEQTANKELN